MRPRRSGRYGGNSTGRVCFARNRNAKDLIGSSRRQFLAGHCFRCESQGGLLDSSCTILPLLRTPTMTQPLPDPVMNRFGQTDGAPIGNLARALLLGWAIFLISGFALARSLRPDPRGFGTHQQIGLPECSVRLLFSRPCPGCGMTTSFSHFVRGEFVEAGRANVAGLLLATLCVVMIPWSLFSAVRGTTWLVDEPMMLLTILIVVIGGIAMVSWLLAICRNV